MLQKMKIVCPELIQQILDVHISTSNDYKALVVWVLRLLRLLRLLT